MMSIFKVYILDAKQLVWYKVSKIKIRNEKTSEQYFLCHVLKVFMCTQSLLSGCQDVSISAPAGLLTLLTLVPRVEILASLDWFC